MIVLGVNAFGENPAACIVVDGVLKGFCQEERLTRLKGSFGHFPTRATGWCLRSQGLTLGDVDRIAIAWDCTKYPWRMLRQLAGMRLSLLLRPSFADLPAARLSGDGAGWTYLLRHTPRAFVDATRDHLRAAGHKGALPRIVFVPHHEAHAYQAFYQSPFPEAAVLVVDGSGEENTVSAFHFRSDGWRRCFSMDVPQSLGWYYGAFTAYLGFYANRDEGKLMGLAALGAARRSVNPWLSKLDAVLKVSPDGFTLDPTFFKFGSNECHPRFTDRLRAFVLAEDRRLEPVGVGEMIINGRGSQPRYLLPEYVDLAYAVQDRLELALLALARRLRRECGSTRLCLAGGVAMNCKANGRLIDEAGFNEVFVHPAASDDGSAIGAAFHVAESNGGLGLTSLTHAQLGPAYSDAEIEQALQDCGACYERPSDIAVRVAELLAGGALCGWVQGGLEMGARALGGRSIIACPQSSGLCDRINHRVKRREGWRPYCPSLTSESRVNYIKGAVETPFMIAAREASPLLRFRSPATVHVDGSVRPQTVQPETLPLWHHLLSSVGRLTGDPVILNTSFNVRGEPIVCTPTDAIRCFFSTGLDALAIGAFLVSKRPWTRAS